MPLTEPPTRIYEPKPPDWEHLQHLSQNKAPDRVYAPPSHSATEEQPSVTA